MVLIFKEGHATIFGASRSSDRISEGLLLKSTFFLLGGCFAGLFAASACGQATVTFSSGVPNAMSSNIAETRNSLSNVLKAGDPG